MVVIQSIYTVNIFSLSQVSCMRSGLLPISQEAMMLGAVATYDSATDVDANLQGEERSAAETAAIRNCLHAVSGDAPPRLLIIRKYGILAMGNNIRYSDD